MFRLFMLHLVHRTRRHWIIWYTILSLMPIRLVPYRSTSFLNYRFAYILLLYINWSINGGLYTCSITHYKMILRHLINKWVFDLVVLLWLTKTVESEKANLFNSLRMLREFFRKKKKIIISTKLNQIEFIHNQINAAWKSNFINLSSIIFIIYFVQSSVELQLQSNILEINHQLHI